MPSRGSRLITVLNAVLAITALAAVAVLLLEYGFRDPLPVNRVYLHLGGAVIVGIFVLDRLARLVLARSKAAYLRENWIDFALIVAALIALAISARLTGRILSAGQLYVVISQSYILISLTIRGVSINLRFASSGIHPTWLLIGSFALLALAGSGLLMLPKATPPDSHIWYPDALFTAISATCVTGLVVRDTGGDFTHFGQAVILTLIQLGGLGIMLFGTVLAMLVGKGLSLRSTNALGQMVAADAPGRLARTAAFIVVVTLILEAVGAVMFYPMFAAEQAAGSIPATGEAVWHSVFHSISSFCNAGFSLYRRNMMAGMADGWVSPLRSHWQIFGVMAPLIVLGGLGFPVLRDLAGWSRAFGRRLLSRAKTSLMPRLTLHSKIVLATSAALLVIGALVLPLIEPRPKPPGRTSVTDGHPITIDSTTRRLDWPKMHSSDRVSHAIFQSVTARTAGFNTIDMKELSNAGKLWLCGLMTVGGSPAGTAGGMKTVTFALLIATAWCVLRRRNELEVFKRSIPANLPRKAVTIAILYLALLATVTLLLCVALPRGHSFIDLFFEACSACGTVGLSAGVTGPDTALPNFGKYVIMAGMFIGRLGPLTLLLALTSRIRHVRYAYPPENVTIG